MKHFLKEKLSVTYLVVSMLCATILIIADYYYSNWTFPLLDTLSIKDDIYTCINDHDEGEEADFDFLYVNVAYDIQLADARDENGDVIGKLKITDRSKLAQFLDIAQKSNYKYIWIDTRFEKGITTESDSVLFALINSMPRLVVSDHRPSEDYQPNPAIRPEKRAYSDYRVRILNPFTRYEFRQDGNASVALRLYSDLNDRTVEETAYGYTDNGKLCYNAQYIPIPQRLCRNDSTPRPVNEDCKVIYPYLSFDLLDKCTEEQIIGRLENKIVFIADFDNDIHESISGDAPGAIITAYAYKTLINKKHLVNYWVQLFLFVIYTAISYRILVKQSNKNERKDVRGKKQFFFIFLKTGVILFILDLLIYFVTALSYTILIPTVFFSLLDSKNDIIYWCKYIFNKLRKQKFRKL